MAEYVYQEKGIHPCILTNGVLINEKNVERFKIFDKVTISLDGHTPELHEKTRGKNTFYKVVESIKPLNIRKGEYRIGCGAGCGEIFIKDNGELLQLMKGKLLK